MVAQQSELASARASGEEAPPLDERAAFLQALRETMQATLATERARVTEDIERRRAAHIAAIDARRELMANRIRELADKDRESIAVWSVDEQIRIERERQRRIQDLERDVEASLAEHDARIDAEIEGAEAAIVAHRAEVEAFFASLGRETDPVEIARRAGTYPQFPSIETNVHAIVSAPPRIQDLKASEVAAPAVAEPVAAEPVAAEATVEAPEAPASPTPQIAAAQEPAPAEETAKPEAPPVPVMDPIAAKRAEWWAAWKELHEPPELSEVLATAEQETETADVLEAVTAGPAARPAEASSSVLISSIPILRPFNWLRRDRDAAEGTNGEK